MRHDLVVDPVHPGNGVSRMILDAVMAELASRSAPRVVFSTAARNESAHRLFLNAESRPTMIEMARGRDNPEP